MKTKPLGYIVYEGKSALDGAPIVVIINKIDDASANSKTGALVQSFIIRSDVEPTEALKTGADASICGQCEHRPLLAKATGKAPCYVNVGRSVLAVYRAYKRGRYARASLSDIAVALMGKRVRIGTYGDGAAAPVEMWQQITRFAAGVVGYTHQWANPDIDAQAWSQLAMASADTVAQARQARAMGYRTFRVSMGVDVRENEISCPASKEAGQKTTCANCMLCGGTTKRAKNIVIADHAVGHAKRVIPLKLAA